jgi:pimeloyl-ACP methyl ester carboxylesterase
MSDTVVLIHGAFAGPWSMDNFAGFFRDRGFACHTPALRYHDGDPKAEPNPALATTSIEDYTDDLADFIQTLDTKPIILGHAVGAVIAQKLAARGLARGIVLINSNVPWGILPSTDDERAVAKGLMEAGPFWKTAMRVQFDLIAPYALNKLDPAAQHAVFDRLGPESGTVMFEMFFWMFDDRRAVAVEFDKVTCPLLVLSGAEDRAVPSVTGRRIAEKYGAKATFEVVPDHAHFMFLEPGWEKVAARCADWISALPSATA